MQRGVIFLKVLISVICLMCIVFLYIFGDRFFREEIQIDPQIQESTVEKDSFVFNPEELVYDGTGELDLLDGVSLENLTPEELKQNVFIKITTGDNQSEKIIEYTADTDEGRIRSKRSLRLVNYGGPKIELPNEMPNVTMENVDSIAELLVDDDGYKAEDGFGNDAREHVQVDVERSMTNSAEVQYTFSLENTFGDQTSAKVDVLISDVPAIIALTAKEVYLQVGDDFEPSAYIERAVDQEGESIIEEVIYNGDFNTAQPGEYMFSYELRGQSASLVIQVAA